MRKVIYIGLVIALCWFAADCARAAELHLPQNAVAGQPLSIGTERKRNAVSWSGQDR